MHSVINQRRTANGVYQLRLNELLVCVQGNVVWLGINYRGKIIHEAANTRAAMKWAREYLEANANA